MTVSLPDPITDWVEAQINAGAYASSSDYVVDLIRRDRERHGASMTLDDVRRRVADSKASGTSPRDVEAIFAQARDIAAGRLRG